MDTPINCLITVCIGIVLDSSALSVTAQCTLSPEVSAEGECVLPIQTYHKHLNNFYHTTKLKINSIGLQFPT